MKILYIGNVTPNTNDLVQQYADKNNTTNWGLISDPKFIPEHDGYYHTTVVDLSPGQIVHLSKYFNFIKLLDQPKKNHENYKTFVTTVRLFCDLENLGLNVEYKKADGVEKFLRWKKFLQENKSFCYFPFAAIVDNIGSTTICAKSGNPILHVKEIGDWRSNKQYNAIREKMIAGELIPEHCISCYERENDGEESTRQFETLEWTERMDIETIEDFSRESTPLYYEFRPSNKCNIRCRMCFTGFSSAIEKEFKKINIEPTPWKLQNSGSYINTIDNYHNLEKIYFAGGEPTVMPEFYEFLRKCIEKGKTDFNLYVGTNGQFFSNKLIELLDHFPKVCFSFSFDGYEKINDYIRWDSDFYTIVENSRKLRERGHTIALQTVFSMWSVSRIHEIFEFYDKEFPNSGLLVQTAGVHHHELKMPFNHPCPELVIESMKRCQQTSMYYQNGRSVKTMIDVILKHYSNPDYSPDVKVLKEFYEFNDKLDKSRNSKLEDYIPELAEARKIYNI